MSENIITRRSALTTGTLTALGVGLMGAIVPKAETAQAAPPAAPALGTVVDMAQLIADSKRALEEYKRGDQAVLETFAALREALTDEQWALYSAHDSAVFVWQMQSEELLLAELCRHLPGLAPAIRVLAAHAYSEASTYAECCLPEGSPS